MCQSPKTEKMLKLNSKNQKNNRECLKSILGGTMYCIKWSENQSKKKSHLISIYQGFVARSLGVLFSLFTTLISMGCWSVRSWKAIQNKYLWPQAEFPYSCFKKKNAYCVYVLFFFFLIFNKTHNTGAIISDVESVETENKENAVLE